MASGFALARSEWNAGQVLRIGILPVLLVGVIVLGVAVGPASIPPGETVRVLLTKIGIPAGHVSAAAESIVWLIRLPEVVGAALVGAALAVAGGLLQAIFRNPLADPYVIGASAGAQVGVVVAILLPLPIATLGFGAAQVLAFAGAVATVMFVYVLAQSSGRVSAVTLLLAGFVVSSFLISMTSLIGAVSGNIDRIVMWTLGDLNVGSWSQLLIAGPLVLLVVVVACITGWRLDVLLLGEEPARSLGVPVEKLKIATVVLASLLTATAVALAGVVAFVGLIVPHAVRLIYGPGHRTLLPVSAILGAVFLILADLIARSALPDTQLPLGVVTAIVGAPFFLYLLWQRKRDYSV
ncbi:MAG TPA: iron ABC transporter permease [Chloroflexota bacterium]|nr:iron ABC transporter permease [Chloroflexota bacterium]